tara:strand:- start:3262 stop:6483 length:3222 start_codon:yes stop_codon:yes gene_type:complete
MEGYTDTILIDCNRQNSEEGKGNNKEQYSQFTNKIGSGVRLNVGDTISVHSGFVSEVGCGQGVIEFTGKNLTTEYEVETTTMTKAQKYWNYPLDNTEMPYQPWQTAGPYDSGYVGFENTKTTYQLHDNEVHLSLSYYKTTNGNGYCQLPRRFDADKVAFDPNDSHNNEPNWVSVLQPTETAHGPEDTYNNGRTMNIGAYPFQRSTVDLRYYKEGRTPLLTPPYESRREFMPFNLETRLWKYKNDNSRYTLFVLTDNYFGLRARAGYFLPDINLISSTEMGDETDITNESSNRNMLDRSTDTDRPRDPCLCEWIKYKEDKKISLETGFQAPQSIADDLTSQLNKRSPDKNIYGAAGGTVPTAGNGHTHSTVGMEQVQVSVESDSETYKGFGCATAFTFTKDNYVQYWRNQSPASHGDADADEHLSVNDYMNSYQTIGIKRPDIWIKGREVLKSCQQITNNVDAGDWIGVGSHPLKSWRNVQYPVMINSLSYADGRDGEIYTNWEWIPENLSLLKEWFDTQSKDQGLFDGYYMSEINESAGGQNDFVYDGLSPNNSRFIHMNITDGFTELGSDNYENDVGTTPTVGAFTSGQSAPLFIYFDEKAKDNAWGGDEVSEMFYGFALKREIIKDEGSGPLNYTVIAFNTSRIGGIPTEFWTGGSKTAPVAGTDAYFINANKDGVANYSRHVGYDPHFNAYGTDAIMLYAGYLNGNANNRTFYTGTATRLITATQQWQQAQNIQKRLVGASAPAVLFDDTSSKFQFSALHTPEYTGNYFDAGDHGDKAINVDAGDPVWFMNKRITKTDFCPDMMPYLIDYTSTIKVPHSEIKYAPHNWNIEPWTVFDADGGVFIDSFNINENDWDRSMMGILGFSYNQFNSINSMDTRQTRINDNIVFDPSGSLTTNAVVNGSDIIQFRSNQFGANLYNNQLPICMNDDAGAQEYEYLPVVSEAQVSSSIGAEHLARKMLTPYYVVRSDIVSDHKFIGGEDGGQALPIVHIVNKENGFGDFFFQSESDNVFTVTNNRTLSFITTSIHNPDMSLATTTDGSGIIYKIVKNNTSDLNIASEILNKKKSKSKK